LPFTWRPRKFYPCNPEEDENKRKDEKERGFERQGPRYTRKYTRKRAKAVKEIERE
jgi:hypothetical protein